MQFMLTGFTQDMGYRVFAFDGVGEDRIRTRFTVRADLALSRRYGIRLQDLPLVCRGVLERRVDTDVKRALTFSEDDMCVYAKGCVAAREAAAAKKKTPRRPPQENVGSAWRVTPI